MLKLFLFCFFVTLIQAKGILKERDINQRHEHKNTVFMKELSPRSNLTNRVFRRKRSPTQSPPGQYGYDVYTDTDSWARGIALHEFATLGESNVFQFTFNENLVFGNLQGRIYRLPDNYVCSLNQLGCEHVVQSNLDTVASFDDVIHQTEASSKYGFERKLDFDASVKQSIAGFRVKGTINTMLMFANSQISKSYSSESIKNTKGSVLGLMNQWSYECTPDYHKMQLDETFKVEVKTLFSGNSLRVENVKSFISRFGSHIYKKVITGKTFYRSIYFLDTAEKNFKSRLEEMSKSKSIDFLGLKYGTNDNRFDNEQNNASFAQKVSFTKSGCVGATDCDMEESCKNNRESSSIIDYQLIPISSLFSRVVANMKISEIQLFENMVKNYTKEVLYTTKPCLAVGCSDGDVCTRNGSCMTTINKRVTKSYKECDPETYQKLVGNDPHSQLFLFHERIQDVCPRNVIWGSDGCTYWNVKHGKTNNLCWEKVKSSEPAPMLRGVPNPVLRCFVPDMYGYGSLSDYNHWLEYYLWYGIYYKDSSKWFAYQNSNKDLVECLDKVTWEEIEPEYKFYTPEFK